MRSKIFIISFLLVMSSNVLAIFKLKEGDKCTAEGKIFYRESNNSYYVGFNIDTNSEMRSQINGLSVDEIKEIVSTKVVFSFIVLKDSFGSYFDSKIQKLEKLEPYRVLKIYNEKKQLCADWKLFL